MVLVAHKNVYLVAGLIYVKIKEMSIGTRCTSSNLMSLILSA